MIPSRKDLAEHYGVDLNTLQKAIANLLADGTVQARGRWGTFVATVDGSAPTAVEPPRRPLDRPVILGIIDEQVNFRGDHYCGDSSIERILESVEREFAASSGATLYAFQDYGEPLRSLRDSASALLARHAEALLIVSYHGLQTSEAVDVARRASVPTVIIAAEDPGVPVPCVYYDNVFAGFQAAEHLLLTGRRSIAFVTTSGKHWEEARLAGARKALEQAGLDSDCLRVWEPGAESASPADCAEDEVTVNLGSSPNITGILASTGAGAVGAYRAMSKLGRRPGDDIALIGFDDLPIMRSMGITAVRPPLEAMGLEAVRMLAGALDGYKMLGQSRLNCAIIPRHSTIPTIREQ